MSDGRCLTPAYTLIDSLSPKKIGFFGAHGLV